ncbi:hypothetical protein AGMMS49949_09190 [Alphaproteobacteria bacterium]|nr:hypothetical protein AGMMS49949_09190 [Alphaproteobacteria bacterium]
MEVLNLNITPLALDKIHEFLEQRQPLPLGIRIFVYQDLNGISHSLSFTDEVSSSDTVFDIDGITFVTDAHSAPFLANMILDFMTVGESSGFVFQNDCASASRSCLNCKGACHARRVQ